LLTIKQIKKRTLVLFLISIFIALFFLRFSRPVIVTSDKGKEFYLFWSWDRGKIEFINSVTGGKVDIYFSLSKDFSNFSMSTNEATENYYTDGTYDINERLKKERRTSLSFASMKGIKLTLGDRAFEIKHGSLKVELLWSTKLL
jgi:hypothetical protein